MKAADEISDHLDAFGERAEALVESTTEAIAEEAREQSWLTWAIWAVLLGIVGWGLFQEQWRTAFVAAITLGLTLLPLVIQRWADFRLPRTLMFLIALFAVLTLVLGEVFDFYERFWWWDIALHSGSAVMFGLFGVILVMLVFDNASIKASPGMVSFFAFCFALAVGAVWEIFEFGMDQAFGLNMQKSGLVDTMWDLIVDSLGAIAGALAGYVYLRFGHRGMVSGLLHEMVTENADKFGPRATETLPG